MCFMILTIAEMKDNLKTSETVCCFERLMVQEKAEYSKVL